MYVSAFPAPVGRLAVSTEGGAEPVWARDGLPLEGYELSPDGADYDVAPAGGQFAMILSRTSGSHLVVVLNALAGGPRTER